MEERGWLGQLTPPEERTLDQAVAGLYKLAAVDLVREPAEVLPADLLAELRDGRPNGKALAFRRVPLTWARWVDWWRRDRAGEPPPPVLPAADGAELQLAALGTAVTGRRPEGGR